MEANVRKIDLRKHGKNKKDLHLKRKFDKKNFHTDEQKMRKEIAKKLR